MPSPHHDQVEDGRTLEEHHKTVTISEKIALGFVKLLTPQPK